MKIQQFENLKMENEQLKARLDLIEKKLGVTSATGNITEVTFNNATLEQNVPNPFTHPTTIGYTLPQQYSSAKIIVTDKLGKVLKEVNLSGSGKGTLAVDAATLSSGVYQYSLYVDGRLIDTRQMIKGN